MSEWEAFQENIRRAMEASARFHEAGEEMVENGGRSEAQLFAARMRELQLELSRIERLLNAGASLISDEIAEIFSQTLYGRSPAYRSTPKDEKE